MKLINHNSQFTTQNGFTLIELLVAIGILGLIIVGANNLFFYTLKGGKKTDAITKIKQNGSYALSSMTTRIRNAASIADCDRPGELDIKTTDGDTITYKITDDQIASNGATLTSNDLTAISLSFTCSGASVIPPTVFISFTLEKTGAQEETASENFQTTVSLRNY
jgi:prepilin-type N-terminal cleavage/methylation domain-containing protein